MRQVINKTWTYPAVVPLFDSVDPHLESSHSSYDPFFVEGGVGTRSQSCADGSAREEHINLHGVSIALIRER